MNIDLMHGDCLEEMKKIPDCSIDLILTDPPYGTTACKWDSIIPLEPMWEQLKRIIKINGVIVMTASQPFTSALIMSNPNMYKCSWLWEKERPSNFFQAKFVPLNNIEDIVVFSNGGANNGSKNPLKYNPQGIVRSSKTRLSSTTGGQIGEAHGTSMKKGDFYAQDGEGYPFRQQKFKNDKNTLHPTQKPVALMKYMIKTYSNENETVLDFTMGSGTTGVACVKTNRNFIGIELDDKYFKIAEERIDKEKNKPKHDLLNLLGRE